MSLFYIQPAIPVVGWILRTSEALWRWNCDQGLSNWPLLDLKVTYYFINKPNPATLCFPQLWRQPNDERWPTTSGGGCLSLGRGDGKRQERNKGIEKNVNKWFKKNASRRLCNALCGYSDNCEIASRLAFSLRGSQLQSLSKSNVNWVFFFYFFCFFAACQVLPEKERLLQAMVSAVCEE